MAGGNVIIYKWTVLFVLCLGTFTPYIIGLPIEQQTPNGIKEIKRADNDVRLWSNKIPTEDEIPVQINEQNGDIRNPVIHTFDMKQICSDAMNEVTTRSLDHYLVKKREIFDYVINNCLQFSDGGSNENLISTNLLDQARRIDPVDFVVKYGDYLPMQFKSDLLELAFKLTEEGSGEGSGYSGNFFDHYNEIPNLKERSSLGTKISFSEHRNND